ncbi:hypothetical protein [Pedobacter steynii]
MPIVFINHYPIDNSLDNWYEATDRIKKYNIQYAICGHGHANQAMDFEGVPATMGRSNLRAKDSIGGYNVVTMRGDSVLFAVKKPGSLLEPSWRSIPLGKFVANSSSKIVRPSYEINNTYSQVKSAWTYHASANVVLTPAAGKKLVVFGNSIGEVEALSIKDGSKSGDLKQEVLFILLLQLQKRLLYWVLEMVLFTVWILIVERKSGRLKLTPQF